MEEIVGWIGVFVFFSVVFVGIVKPIDTTLFVAFISTFCCFLAYKAGGGGSNSQ